MARGLSAVMGFFVYRASWLSLVTFATIIVGFAGSLCSGRVKSVYELPHGRETLSYFCKRLLESLSLVKGIGFVNG